MSVRSHLEGSVLRVTLDNPPVNGLSHLVRTGLYELLENVRQSPEIQAVLIHGAGRCFSAGGDIREIGTAAGMAPPGLSSHIHPAIERCGKPVIAVLHGLAFGGGFETALACHYRVACADTRIALPEVGLGIIPLSATQRLPRVLGLRGALEMIVGQREYVAGDLRSMGLFDLVVAEPATLLDSSLRFAQEVLSQPGPYPLVREQKVPDTDPEAILEAWRVRLGAAGASETQRAALVAIAASFQQPDFDAGLDRARTIYNELYRSPEATAARDGFLERRSELARNRIPGSD